MNLRCLKVSHSNVYTTDLHLLLVLGEHADVLLLLLMLLLHDGSLTLVKGNVLS